MGSDYQEVGRGTWRAISNRFDKLGHRTQALRLEISILIKRRDALLGTATTPLLPRVLRSSIVVHTVDYVVAERDPTGREDLSVSPVLRRLGILSSSDN